MVLTKGRVDATTGENEIGFMIGEVVSVVVVVRFLVCRGVIVVLIVNWFKF